MKNRKPKSSSLISTHSSYAPVIPPSVVLHVVLIRREALAVISHGPTLDTTVEAIQTGIAKASPRLRVPWEMAAMLGS